MSQRAHRVKEVVYAEGVSFSMTTTLADVILNHEETNDQRNQDAGGMIEIPFSGLRDIFENAVTFGLNAEDTKTIELEIQTLEKEGKEDDEYVLYDIF